MIPIHVAYYCSVFGTASTYPTIIILNYKADSINFQTIVEVCRRFHLFIGYPIDNYCAFCRILKITNLPDAEETTLIVTICIIHRYTGAIVCKLRFLRNAVKLLPQH